MPSSTRATTATPGTPAREFPLFGALPTEIRLAIWRQCLPNRIVELDIPEANICNGPVRTLCKLFFTTRQNRAPPAITRVCREARAVALEHGCEFDSSSLSSRSGGDQDWEDFEAPNLVVGPWFQPGRDIAHLHWSDFYDGYFYMDQTGDPVPFLQAVAAKGAGASIMAELLYRFDDDEFSEHLAACLSTDTLEFLPRCRDYLVTITMVNIHVPYDNGLRSGLFGLLGDEPIQLVDPSDSAAITAFHNLWAEHGCQGDVDVAGFFDVALGSDKTLTRRIQQWCKHLEKLWVWHEWIELKDDEGFPTDDEIWLPPMAQEGSGNAAPLPELSSLWKVDIRIRDHNMGNWWVAKVVANMPTFRPRIMFRLCGKQCYEE
ncbi:hypothetical protein B0T19DRAFT_440565 [Cercophora scortea]|uniref:2EXR domain-containing protein n=1 Tax=Cercophora scortea TaxID=314031 RepID=A0AAE0IZ24_9PEZI|nr:hypothetical protein B0T19DRAFT_440565 [Cercophora scortea]